MCISIRGCVYKLILKSVHACMKQEGELDLAAEPHQFVSSVCWSHKGHTLLAANSQGTLKLLELD